jgi:hypothetical protein
MWLLLRTNTVRATLAGFKFLLSAQRKTPKGGTKGAHAPGRTRGLGRTRENLPNVGDAKNGTAGL